MTIRNIVVDSTRSPNAKLRAVPASAFKLADGFWSKWVTGNHDVTIPTQYQQCEKTGRIDNFRVAAGRQAGEFKGLYFNDSDVHKWLEAACWALGERANAGLSKTVDELLDLIAAAQQPDGYLNTYFMGDRAKERWSNLKDKHEMYCAGHFLQAAVAHHRALGGDKALSVAMKLADCICAKFGPAESGRTPGTCGHPEIEMSLVELYRETQDRKYLDQAKYLIDARGHKLIGGSSYHQDHKPLREFTRMEGHAVRMLYLCSGAADLCMEREEPELRATLEKLWTHLTTRQLYITGGVGSRWDGEAFGNDYELPNTSAYAETCGAIASIMWSWRMLLLTGESKYADLIEQTLFNGFLSGLSTDCQHYFYQNPLANDGRHRRVPWFECACCPPNVARLLASLPGYIFSTSDDGAIWMHQFASGSARIETAKSGVVEFDVQTSYPWDGKVVLTMRSAGQQTINLRVPVWCQEASLRVNGKPVPVQQGTGYAFAEGNWKPGDTIELELPMPARRVEANPRVSEGTGRVAIMRGPVVYCVEDVDQPGVQFQSLAVSDRTKFRDHYDAPDLSGACAVEFDALVDENPLDWKGSLYQPTPDEPVKRRKQAVRAVPYHLWANRKSGPMAVWLRRVD